MYIRLMKQIYTCQTVRALYILLNRYIIIRRKMKTARYIQQKKADAYTHFRVLLHITIT